ncbi:MAG: hypothetical protein WBA16_04860 [Nonlabens sp.]
MVKEKLERELNLLNTKIDKQLARIDQEPEHEEHLTQLKRLLELKLGLEDRLSALY